MWYKVEEVELSTSLCYTLRRSIDFTIFLFCLPQRYRLISLTFSFDFPPLAFTSHTHTRAKPHSPDDTFWGFYFTEHPDAYTTRRVSAIELYIHFFVAIFPFPQILKHNLDRGFHTTQVTAVPDLILKFVLLQR